MLELVTLLDRIPVLGLEGTTETRWADWLMNFKTIMAVIFDDLPERKKVSSFASKLLPSFTPVFKALDLNLDEVEFEELVVSLTQYFKSVNTRMTFYSRVQKKEESFEEFATDLDALSRTCDYGNDRLSIVRDMFIFNLNPKHANVKKRILQEAKLPLRETVDLASELLKGSGALSNPVPSLEPPRSQEAPSSRSSGGRRSLPASDVESNSSVKFGKGSRGAQKGNRTGQINGNADDHFPDGEASKPNKDFRRSVGGGFRHESEAKNARKNKSLPCSLSDSASGADVALRAPLAQGKFVKVKVACIDANGLVHVCLEENLVTLENIDAAIRNSQLRPIIEAKPNFRCAAKFVDFWCRVRILDVDHKEQKASVRYLDYGNREWLPIKELVFLPDELVHTPGPLSFPISVPQPENLEECASLEVMLKEKDERGVWTVEKKRSDGSVTSSGKRNMEEFGSASERHGGPNAGERGNWGKYGSTGRGSRKNEPDTDGERWNLDKVGPSDGEFRQGGHNGEVRSRGKFGPPDDERPGGRNAGGGGYRDKLRSTDCALQTGPNTNDRRNRREPMARQGGRNDGTNDRSNWGEPVDSSRQGGRSEEGRRGLRDKFAPTENDRHSGSGRDSQRSSGSAESASRLSATGPRSSTSNADLEIPDMRNLSIDSRAPPIPLNTFTNVVVTDNSTEFCVFDSQFSESFNRLSDSLKEWSAQKSRMKVVRNPSEGLLVCAEFEGFWSRALIISIVDEGRKAKVKFVDWGNEDVVATSNLMVLPNELEQAPLYTFSIKVPQSVRTAYSCGDELKIKPKFRDSDGSWFVEVEGVPEDTSPRKPRTTAQPKRFDDTPPRHPHPPPIPRDEFTKVLVVYVGSEGAFATPTDKLAVLDRISKEVVDVARTAGPARPDVDNIVAAPYEGETYRARILSVDEATSKARVLFVDFGNESEVPFDVLLALPARLTDHIYTFKFTIDSPAFSFLAASDELSVMPIAPVPGGAWLLEADATPSDPALPDVGDDRVGATLN